MTHKKSIALVLSLLILLVPLLTLAQPDFGTGYIGGSNLPQQDVRYTIVNLINVILGILGIIVLIGIIIGGFMIMTAGGDSQREGQGRKIAANSAIGLLVIFLAFAITTFVFNVLLAAA